MGIEITESLPGLTSSIKTSRTIFRLREHPVRLSDNRRRMYWAKRFRRGLAYEVIFVAVGPASARMWRPFFGFGLRRLCNPPHCSNLPLLPRIETVLLDVIGLLARAVILI